MGSVAQENADITTNDMHDITPKTPIAILFREGEKLRVHMFDTWLLIKLGVGGINPFVKLLATYLLLEPSEYFLPTCKVYVASYTTGHWQSDICITFNTISSSKLSNPQFMFIVSSVP